MKANYMNYFKKGNLYQWDQGRNVLTISPTNIEQEFCLDKRGMEMFIRLFEQPGSEIALDKSLLVKAGKMKANIKLSNEPLIKPSVEFDKAFKVPTEWLKKAVKFTSSKLNEKPVLSGVNIGTEGVKATTGFIACKFKLDGAEENYATLSKEFIETLPTTTEPVEFRCNNSTVASKIGDVIYIGRLVDGVYPSMVKIYSVPPHITRVAKKELTDLLVYAAKEDYVKLAKNHLTIDGESNLESEIELDLEAEIWLKADQLKMVLGLIETEEIEIGYTSGERPVFFNESYLILPIKRY